MEILDFFISKEQNGLRQTSKDDLITIRRASELAEELLHINMNEEKKCVECGAHQGHSPICSLMDEKCAKEMLAHYYDLWLNMKMEHRKYTDVLYKRIEKAKKDAEFWKGKFVVVKNENNCLRIKVTKDQPTKSK